MCLWGLGKFDVLAAHLTPLIAEQELGLAVRALDSGLLTWPWHREDVPKVSDVGLATIWAWTLQT